MGLRLDEWKERYENKEIVNIKNEFTINELELLQKLGVELIDKLYTEREFEILDMKVISYYYEDTMSNDEKAECIPLPEGVSREEYNNLVDKIHAINFFNWNSYNVRSIHIFFGLATCNQLKPNNWFFGLITKNFKWKVISNTAIHN